MHYSISKLMRQSFLLCLILLCMSGCAAPAPTSTLGAPITVPRATIALQATRARPTLTPTTPATVAPTSTRAPTATFTPIPTATAVPAQFTQLMDGACCVNPGWLPDSTSVIFIDKPQTDASAGMYRVALSKPRVSELWSERIAFYTPEFDYAQIPEPTGTRLIRVSDGQEWVIKNGGRAVQLAPDRTRLVWTETRETFPIENRVSNIMLANLDGSEPQRILQVLRGGVSGWLDNNRLLVNGRAARDTFDTILAVYDLRANTQTEIARAERIRLAAPSPDGKWIVYGITNDADAARNGLWLARTGGAATRKLDFFGPAQWRDVARLIYVPFELNALNAAEIPTHAFFEYDIETDTTRRLTPSDQPFTIASGDWDVSPDGKKIVLVNAADNNLWFWQFP